MSGFCGRCGRPRTDSQTFCGGCGQRLPPPVQMCPTCGQPWSGEPLPARSSAATPAAVSLPRGPEPGPDYDEATDCGNCGFDRPAGSEPCPSCGSENTGPEFRPSA